MPNDSSLVDQVNAQCPIHGGPDREPRWIRCYDNGGQTFDRYTVVFTRGKRTYLGMSAHPCHPQGFGQHGEWRKGESPIDRPAYGHLGKRIAFSDLPEEVQRCVRRTYQVLWGETPMKCRRRRISPRTISGVCR